MEIIVFEGINCSGKTTKLFSMIDTIKAKTNVMDLEVKKFPSFVQQDKFKVKDCLDSSSFQKDCIRDFVDFKPKSTKGVLLIDRYFFSSFAYQGNSYKPDITTYFYELQDQGKLLKPDCILYFSVTYPEYIERMKKRLGVTSLDKNFILDEKQFNLICTRYKYILSSYSTRCKIVELNSAIDFSAPDVSTPVFN